MELYYKANGNIKKKDKSGGIITTPVFYLRAVELGLEVSDIDELEVGFILDLFTVKINDNEEPEPRMATQEDIDNF